MARKAIGEAPTRNGGVGRPINPTSPITRITHEVYLSPTWMVPTLPCNNTSCPVSSPKDVWGQLFNNLLFRLNSSQQSSLDPCKVPSYPQHTYLFSPLVNHSLLSCLGDFNTETHLRTELFWNDSLFITFGMVLMVIKCMWLEWLVYGTSCSWKVKNSQSLKFQ